MPGPLEIFFSYAHEDEDLMNDDRRQLIVYERNGRILKWHDRMISPGTAWRDRIDRRLEAANVILLFMSPHFIESRYCYEIEGQAALQKLQAGQARVVPVILRPCAWEETPFGAIQALPSGARPISRWTDRDEGCLDAARGVMKVVDELAHQRHGRLLATPVAASTDSKVVYCRRCGQVGGEQSHCTGTYVHHDFARGFARDHCARCGVHPGAQTVCTGTYTHHRFERNASLSVMCSRCGVRPGAQSVCTGIYTHHNFVEM